jgi:hypothetical protein
VSARRKPVERALSAAREENSEFRLAVGFLHGHFRLAHKGGVLGLVPEALRFALWEHGVERAMGGALQRGSLLRAEFK